MKTFEFETTGKIVYDPPRPAGLSRGNDFWCIIRVDKEITRYYRSQVNNQILNPLKFESNKQANKFGFSMLDPPSFDAHLTVVRGRSDVRNHLHTVMQLWKKYHGTKVTVRYSMQVRKSGDTTGDRPDSFWFVNADCDMFHRIREEMGLTSRFNPHITIGRYWDIAG